MMGYFRAPAEQLKDPPGTPKGCPALLGPAKAFRELIESFNPKRRRLLVAMGDTFAPRLLARTLTVNGPGKQFHLGKDLYTWDFKNPSPKWIEDREVEKRANLKAALDAGMGKLEMDNVACFLQAAGFDALVPGKHDFYFGPERLRELARLLAERRIDLLAANLTVASSVPDAAPRVPDRQRKNKGFLRDRKGVKANLPDVVLPSLRQFVITGALNLKLKGNNVAAIDLPAHTRLSPEVRIQFSGAPVAGRLAASEDVYSITPTVTGALLCKSDRYSGTYSDPDDLDFDSGTPAGCIPLEPMPVKELTTDLTFRFAKKTDGLEQDQNYHLCAMLVRSQPYCAPFSVHSPLFDYQHPSSSAPAEDLSKPAHYKIKNVGTERDPYWVAVFGVVDPSLLGLVGALNDSWVNVVNGKKYATQIEASDPLSALKQVVQECEEEDRCLHARKVLLAQMDRGKAAQLATRMKPTFDLVIADTDPAVYTQEETITRSPENENDSANPFVVAPRPHGTDDPKTIDIRLSRATVTLPPGCEKADCSGKRVLDNHVEVKPGVPLLREPLLYESRTPTAAPPATPQPETLITLVRKFVAKKTPGFPPLAPNEEEASTLVAQAALLAMREKYHTDIAMVQTRDVWDPAGNGSRRVDPRSLQELLDVIFWKGDFVFREPVTGATLNSVMAQSKKWAAQDKDALNTDLETKRSLIALGLFQDAESKSLIVGGIPADDARLYAVAMTDYLAFGDTGYPDLQKPAVPPLDRVSDNMTMVSLSGLLCKAITETVDGYKDTTCHDVPVRGKYYLDHLVNRPFDTTPGITPPRHIVDWLTFRRTQNIFEAATPAEKAVQQRRLFSFTLDKADFGYTLNEHNNGTEAQLASKFSGVSVAPVSAADSFTVSTDYSFRAAMSTRYFELFSQNDMAYVKQSQRGADNAFVQSQKSNSLATELGLTTRIYPWRRRQVSNLKILTSLRMETQAAPPLTGFSLGGGKKLTDAIDRSERFYGKIGLRYDDAKSWVEAGYEPGLNFNTPVAYVFNPGSGNQTCNAIAGQVFVPPGAPKPTPQAPDENTSLADCVSYWASTIDPSTNNPFITSTTKFRPITADRREHGFFLNFKASIPLPFNSFGKPAFYVMTGKSDWFLSRHDDVSLDTKYLIDWSHSLVVPLFGNLSIVPKFEVFYYENKVEGNTFRDMQSSVTFQYAFDWHRGLNLWKVLKYPNPSALAQAGGK
jgi:2',3'-cyclic-nucleotide 2'-phosphodiesterase (5'-nucleotidase family)